MQNEENELNEAELEQVIAGLPLEAINDLQPEMVAENTGDVQAQQSEELKVEKEDKVPKEGFFKKLFNRIRVAFQKDVKQLPEGNPPAEQSKREIFLKNLQDGAVSNETLENDELSLEELDKVTTIPPTPEKGEER